MCGTPHHEVRYAVPADLTADGTFGHGWTVVTDTAIALKQAGAEGWRTFPCGRRAGSAPTTWWAAGGW